LFGNRALISTIRDDTAALNAGAAYLFDTVSGALLHTFLNPTPELNNTFGNNDNFGFSVALSATRIAIGAPNEGGVNRFHNGAVYLYDLATYDLQHARHSYAFKSDFEEFPGNDVALSGISVSGRAVPEPERVGARISARRSSSTRLPALSCKSTTPRRTNDRFG
jgi:hypothetical protein